MKAVLFSLLFIAGLVTLSSGHNCNNVCAATLCLKITSKDCVKEGGMFNPSNPDLEVHPCICCDSCTINRNVGESCTEIGAGYIVTCVDFACTDGICTVSSGHSKSSRT